MSSKKKSASAKRSESPSSEPETSSSEKVDAQDYFDPFAAEETPPEEEPEAEASEEDALPEDAPEKEASSEAEEDALEEEEPAEEEAEKEAPEEEAPEQESSPEAEEDALEEAPEPEAPEHDEKDAEERASPRDVPAPPLSQKKPRPVLMTERVVEPVLRDAVRTSSAVLGVVGGGLSLVWVTEMLLLWFPLDLQNPAWTFGTVVQTVDILPSAAVGGALLTYGLIRHPRAPTRIVRRLSTVFALLAGLFVVIGYFYLLSIAPTFARAPDVSVQPLRRTVIQTVIQLLVAAATCSGLAAVLWRGVKKGSRTVGP